MRARAVSAYGVALALGVAVTLWIFPPWALLGGVPPGAPIGADFATHVIGQRYFFATPWHWPLLMVPGPLGPQGVNIAFTDSIPLAAIAAKALRGLLPPFDQVITIWQALCWVLQPVAAVFALRALFEKRLGPAIAIAILALTQPIFITRFRHAALCSQFTILLMLGLYFRIVRGSRAALVTACAIEPLILLIHPYLAAMGGAVLAAAPLTLLLRRDRAWRVVAAGVAISAAAIIGLSAILGYNQGISPGGFGIFSMNLASPFYPVGSSLLLGLPFEAADATGGQLDAPAYLGAGLLLLLAWVATAGRAAAGAGLKAHAGLALCCAALTILAVSNRIFLFQLPILDIPLPAVLISALEPLRSSGRMFWPVTYVLLLGGTIILLRTNPRLALTFLPLVVALQVADSRGLIFVTRARLRTPVPWEFDPDRMRALAAGAARITVLPIYGCYARRDDLLMQPLWIASETHAETNTAYLARMPSRSDCGLAAPLAIGPRPGELLVVQPGLTPLVAAEPYAAHCRSLSAYTVCSLDEGKLAGLPPLGGLPEVDTDP